MQTREEREERLQRERIREERHRERERERRLEAEDTTVGKKSKISRDRDRDISEKVALGMASTKGTGRGDGLFTAQPTLSTLYRPKKDIDADMCGGGDEEADPFGLDQFLTEVKKGKKAMDMVGSGGTMKAIAGSAMQDGYKGGGSGRSRIEFEGVC
ncbi:hypothetical protein CsatA_020188 [Cannabis sativa]